jgi:hypothetical protein
MKSCKVNDAAHVKPTTPLAMLAAIGNMALSALLVGIFVPKCCTSRRHKTLDKLYNVGVIIFTELLSRLLLYADAETTAPRSKAPESAPARLAQPASARRYRRAVCHQRFLRSPRSGSSQVRDAPPRAGRRPADYRSNRQVRLLPTVVLSGSGGFQGRRSCRPYTPKTGSETGQQAYGRGNRIHSADLATRPVVTQFGLGSSHPGAIRHRGSPSNDRARASPASKKTPNLRVSSGLQPNEAPNWLGTMSNSGSMPSPYILNRRTLPDRHCSSEAA